MDSKGVDYYEDVGVFSVRKLLNLGLSLIREETLVKLLALSHALIRILFCGLSVFTFFKEADDFSVDRIW